MTMGTALLVGFLVALIVVIVGYMPDKREGGYEGEPPDNYMPQQQGGGRQIVITSERQLTRADVDKINLTYEARRSNPSGWRRLRRSYRLDVQML